jgi:hypothetical protein
MQFRRVQLDAERGREESDKTCFTYSLSFWTDFPLMSGSNLISSLLTSMPLLAIDDDPEKVPVTIVDEIDMRIFL